jgi:hypothetical protein
MTLIFQGMKGSKEADVMPVITTLIRTSVPFDSRFIHQAVQRCWFGVAQLLLVDVAVDWDMVTTVVDTYYQCDEEFHPALFQFLATLHANGLPEGGLLTTVLLSYQTIRDEMRDQLEEMAIHMHHIRHHQSARADYSSKKQQVLRLLDRCINLIRIMYQLDPDRCQTYPKAASTYLMEVLDTDQKVLPTLMDLAWACGQETTINQRDSNGWTVLVHAVNDLEWSDTQLSIVGELLEHKADVNVSYGLAHTRTPLWDAVMNGNNNLVKFLIEHGADPQHRNIRNQTLYEAAGALEQLTLETVDLLQLACH